MATKVLKYFVATKLFRTFVPMKQMILFLVAMALVMSCGQSYEEKRRITRQQQRVLQRQDSAALKVAVLPTIDCLPLFVASDRGFFKKYGADIRLKYYTAQMDCDTALDRHRVEGMVSDLVRTERLQHKDDSLCYVTSTNAYWQLITNRNARIRELKQLDDKMIAMTRYSATDFLTDVVVDSAKLVKERVFRVQINDLDVRLRMLLGNEMDAMFLTEPQATLARKQKHTVVLDSRTLDIHLGVVAFRQRALQDTARQRQLRVFLKAYDEACDSLNRLGLKAYADIMAKRCHLKDKEVDLLPKDLKFHHVSSPLPADIERARQWLKKQ